MQSLFGVLPAWVTLLILTVVPAGVITAAHALFRRRVNTEELRSQQEVAGFLVAVVAVIYAVVLGFIVVTASIAFDSAQNNADDEAGDVSDIAGITRLLDEPQRSELRSLLGKYAFEVRDVEWPMLAQGKEDTHARDLLYQIIATLETPPKRSSNFDVALARAGVRQHLLETIHDLRVHRRQRMIDAKSHLPHVMYFTLILGGLFVVSFAFLFGVESGPLQLYMTFAVSASIAMLFGLVFMLDRPYTGSYHINSEAFTAAIDNFHLRR